MGRDKAFVEVSGEPLWRRQVGVLQRAGAVRVAVARRRGQAPIGHAGCLLDEYEGRGPLAGLHAGLKAAGSGRLAVLAVDMPGVDEAWFAWLAGLCGPGSGAAASSGGVIEPLAALYPAEALGEAASRLERGELSATGFVLALAGAGMMTVAAAPPAYAGRLRSLNEPPAGPSAPPGGCSSPPPR
jgi:molybdopterin-guanine dinucleotide biosynthesis protein A